MFPPPFYTRLALLIVYVAAVSAAPRINAPDGSSFAITSPPDSPPTFGGSSVNYDPTQVANLDDPGDFTVLAPGESTDVTHDLPVTHSFTQPGAVVSPQVHEKRISWRPGKSKSKPASLPKPEPEFLSCSDEQKQMIEMATADAKKYVGIAVLDSEKIWALGPHMNREGLHKTWFGEYSKDNAEKVMNTLQGMQKNFPFMGFDYDCNCDEMVTFDIISARRQIRLCRRFWGFNRNDKSVQLVRVAGSRLWTTSQAVGLAAAYRLAREHPAATVTNLDNYIAFIWKADTMSPPPYVPLPPDEPPPPYSEQREGL